MNISPEVLAAQDEVIALRRDFHMHPELGFSEYRTSEVVMEYLKNLGLEPKKIAGTGVVAIIKGNKAGAGKTILLRADMDALPVQEENDVPYKSQNPGIMHACGHDGHTAMLLVAAKILMNHRDEFSGNIKLVFQPNEEESGAYRLIEEGVLENPKVDASFGIHLWTQVESGKIGLVVGPTMAEMYNFKIVLHGKGGHTSAPQQGIDPIICAANIIQTTQILQTREINPMEATVIMYGMVHGGTKTNIIPEEVVMEGSLRYLYDGKDDGPQHPRKRFERIVKGICDAHRIEGEITFEVSNYILSNDAETVKFLKDEVMPELVDGNMDLVIPYVCMGGEDFSEFSNHNNVPGAFIFVGNGDPAKGTDAAHHAPNFKLDEDTLVTGVQIHVSTALNFLK